MQMSRTPLPSPSPSFAQRLIDWQIERGRHDLPWQATRDPYRIWLSEIMLQQTQVSAAIPYFERFLKRFPDLPSLAQASADHVLEAWSGLGYYARARHLHRCAQQVMAAHGGMFPEKPEDLVKLAGIGRSTAAAIAVFSSGVRAAILDGNVKRVFCRHAAIAGYPGSVSVERQLWLLAESRLPERQIEAYTQGLMDLGATLCKRRRPDCHACPVASDCLARKSGQQEVLPTPRTRPPLPERRCTFVLILHDNAVLLQRRPPSGIWGGLLVPPEGTVTAVLANLGLHGQDWRELATVTNDFSHFRLYIEPVICRLAGPTPALCDDSWHWQSLDQIATAALPTPIRKLLAELTAR